MENTCFSRRLSEAYKNVSFVLKMMLILAYFLYMTCPQNLNDYTSLEVIQFLDRV